MSGSVFDPLPSQLDSSVSNWMRRSALLPSQRQTIREGGTQSYGSESQLWSLGHRFAIGLPGYRGMIAASCSRRSAKACLAKVGDEAAPLWVWLMSSQVSSRRRVP